jgi:hypothetical protein
MYLGKALSMRYPPCGGCKLRSSSQAVLDVEDASCTARAEGIPMVAPAVEGIDLLKLDVL